MKPIQPIKFVTSTIFLISLPFFATFAQDLIISSETGLVTYEVIVKVDSIKADKLFSKAKIWVIENFKNPKLKEVERSLIATVFVLNVNIGLGVTNPFYHDVKIKIKDGAIKMVIDNIYNEIGHDTAERLFIKDGVVTGKSQKKWLKQINDNCVLLGKSLQQSIEKKDEW